MVGVVVRVFYEYMDGLKIPETFLFVLVVVFAGIWDSGWGVDGLMFWDGFIC